MIKHTLSIDLQITKKEHLKESFNFACKFIQELYEKDDFNSQIGVQIIDS